MKIEIWSDVMCPFCYIGKKNLEAALEQFPDKDQIEIVWKSYQLDPNIPSQVNNTYSGYLSKKRNVSEAQGSEMLASVAATARQAGIDIYFDKTIMTSSFRAHLLIQYAKTKGKGDAMEERLFKAFFTDGENVYDIPTLTRLGKEVGLDEVDLLTAFSDDSYAYAVNNDIKEATQIGVTGVPFFVLNRKYAISGAQPAQAFLETITKAFNDWKPKNNNLEIDNGDSCSIDGQCD